MSSRAHRQHAVGFTLAEVVLALLIFGLAAAVLGQAVTETLRAVSKANRHEPLGYPIYRVRTHVMAMPTRAEIEEGGELEVPVSHQSKETGTAETEVVRTRWEAEIFPTGLLDVYVLELTINFESADIGPDSYEARYMAYRPGWGDSDETERLLELKEETFKERLTARGIVEDEEG